jgi:hypothetical protein
MNQSSTIADVDVRPERENGYCGEPCLARASVQIAWAQSRHARTWMALLLMLIAAHGMAAPAPRIELQAGQSYEAAKGKPAMAVFVEGVFAQRAIGSTRLTWAPDVSAGWINGRNEPRYHADRYTTSDHIWLLAGGARFRYGSPNDWYHHLFFSFQPALHTGRTRALSSAYEFVSTLGWQAKRISIQVRHISNGSLHEPNCGETMLLLGVRLP